MDLPRGWVLASLGEITSINPSHHLALDPSMEISFVPMAGISSKEPTFNFSEIKPLSDVRKNYSHFAEDDVLFAKITPCMENGKSAIAKGLKNGLGCGTTELHVLRPYKGVESKIVYYYIHQESFRKDAARHMTGTAGHLRVPVGYIKSAKIPLPPEKEQHRLVAKLEKLLARVDKSKERLEKIPAILKRFRQSVLAAACSGELTVDWRRDNTDVESAIPLLVKLSKGRIRYKTSKINSWLDLRVNDVFSSHGGGTPPKNNPDYWGGDIPWIASGDVKNDYIARGSHFITRQGLKNSSARLCKPNSVIVVVRSGVLKHTLPIAIVEKSLSINQDIKCFDSGDVTLNYWFFLYLKAHQNKILSFNREGTTVQSVKYETLKNLVISIPPISEQLEIRRRTEVLFRIAHKIESRYLKSRVHVERLTQSILGKAFRGELVPQDPNEESASELLKRIRAEKAKQEAQKRKKRERKPR